MIFLPQMLDTFKKVHVFNQVIVGHHFGEKKQEVCFMGVVVLPTEKGLCCCCDTAVSISESVSVF